MTTGTGGLAVDHVLEPVEVNHQRRATDWTLQEGDVLALRRAAMDSPAELPDAQATMKAQQQCAGDVIACERAAGHGSINEAPQLQDGEWAAHGAAALVNDVKGGKGVAEQGLGALGGGDVDASGGAVGGNGATDVVGHGAWAIALGGKLRGKEGHPGGTVGRGEGQRGAEQFTAALPVTMRGAVGMRRGGLHRHG